MAQKVSQYDLIIIGADRPGLAGAACAARFGAKVALIKTGQEEPEGASSSGAPNFVWRQLGLHESGLTPRPVSARISLFADGRRVKTFESGRKTENELRKAFPADGGLWAEFNAMAGRLRNGGANRAVKSKSAANVSIGNGPSSVFNRYSSPLSLGPRPTAKAVDTLSDYFEDIALRTHLAHTALSAFALGGDEAGSVEALAALATNAAWPVRDGATGPGLTGALLDACSTYDVATPAAALRGVGPGEGKTRLVELEDGQVLRCRKLMASTARQARLAGLHPQSATSPLNRRAGTDARIRIKLGEKASIENCPPDAIFYVAADPDELRRAHDAVLEGRIPEELPLSFEIKGEEIFVRAPYCPQTLADDEGQRSWTQQDRQAFGKQILARVMKFLDQPASAVRQVDVTIASMHDNVFDGMIRDDEPDGARVTVAAPAPNTDEIGAAAAMAISAVSNG